MENQSIFIEKAYKDALDYADKTINLSTKIKNNYTRNDEFYYEMKENDISIMVMCFIIGIVALIFKGKLWNFLGKYLSDKIGTKIDIDVLKNYFSMIYTIGAVIILCIGLWQLFKLLYRKKVEAELKNIDMMINEIEKEKRLLDGVKLTVSKAISDFEYIQVGNANKWEQKIDSYREKVNGIGIKTRNIKRNTIIAGCIASIIIFLIVLNPFIIDALSGSFTYSEILIVCSFYLLLMEVIYRTQMILVPYIGTWAKYIGIILFVLYQIVLGIQLQLLNVFNPLIELVKYSPKINSENLLIIIKYMINKGLLVFACSSLTSLMSLIRTNVEHEYLVGKEGVDIPLDDGSVRHIKANTKWISFFLASIFVLIAPFFMSELLIKSITFGRIVLYIVLGFFWFVISILFTGDDSKTLYGKRLVWVKNIFFFSYLFLTLAMVPGFELGDIVAILVQSIVAIIVLAILACVL